MSNEAGEVVGAFLLLLFIAVFMFLGGMFGYEMGDDAASLKHWTEAEERGYAEKYITEDMRIEFRWINDKDDK